MDLREFHSYSVSLSYVFSYLLHEVLQEFRRVDKFLQIDWPDVQNGLALDGFWNSCFVRMKEDGFWNHSI